MKINLKKLKKEKKRNFKERMKFIKFWTEYIKKNSDKKWSKQQNILINSQLK